MPTSPADTPTPALSLDEVVIRFAGDSGDGMQLTGSQFTNTSALAGNDLATFPDYPAEIRAPIGTTFGVSGFQLRFASHSIHTPGDAPDVLVAMNPAALKNNIADLKAGGVLIANTGNFNDKFIAKAGYEADPLDDPTLEQQFTVVKVDLNKAAVNAVKETDLTPRQAERCKNILALGMLYWVYSRSLEPTEKWLKEKFANKPEILKANILALHAGFAIAENSEIFQNRYDVLPADLDSGTYRNLMGNAALSMGLVAASHLSGLKLFLGSYPITPASDILHNLAHYKHHGVVTFQAEDEIAAITAAIGASFAGSLGITATSGPGLALKGEAMGLAVMTELPLLVINVQRGGPSTGMPTKTEQADLLQAMFGRHGECPIPIIAPQSPSNCFQTALEAAEIAVKFMTPVLILSDGSIANGAEPFKVPSAESLKPFPVKFHTESEGFLPYQRDEETYARPWALPGTPNLEHRLGGLEKSETTGNVDYGPENHERMVQLRADKVQAVANTYAPLEVFGEKSGKLLVLGWGSTYGSIHGAVDRAQNSGHAVSQLHLRNLWPLPSDLGEVLGNFEHVLLPEMNSGQLNLLIRGHYLVDTDSMTKIQGRPFSTGEILERIQSYFA